MVSMNMRRAMIINQLNLIFFGQLNRQTFFSVRFFSLKSVAQGKGQSHFILFVIHQFPEKWQHKNLELDE